MSKLDPLWKNSRDVVCTFIKITYFTATITSLTSICVIVVSRYPQLSFINIFGGGKSKEHSKCQSRSRKHLFWHRCRTHLWWHMWWHRCQKHLQHSRYGNCHKLVHVDDGDLFLHLDKSLSYIVVVWVYIETIWEIMYKRANHSFAYHSIRANLYIIVFMIS